MTFTLHAHRSVALPTDGSWTYVAGSFGARLWDNGDGTYTLRLSNGAIGRGAPGGFFFDTMSIDHPGGTITIGNGGEYFPPRAIKIVRFGSNSLERTPLVTRHAHLALPASLAAQKPAYDALGARMAFARTTGVADPGIGLYASCGMWMPLGETQGGAPGGTGIDPYPGWDRSSAYHLLAHDLTMERHAVEYVDADTGEPINLTMRDYRLSRGWSKVTQLQEFVIPYSLQPWDDRRLPKDNGNGPCAYRDALLAYMPHDGQHLVRATKHAKVAAFLFGDLCAQFDLYMIAVDGFNGTRSELPLDAGKGADMGRSYAWVMDALLASGLRRHAEKLVRASNRAQTPSGAWWYAASANEQWSGFNPSPWRDLGLNQNQFATHTMETAYLASSMSLAGQQLGAEAAMLPLLRLGVTPRQWIGLHDDFRTYGDGVGSIESFQMWPAIGRIATVNPAWRREMVNLVPPGAGAVCGPNVKAALLAAGFYEATAKALESLEA